MTVTIRTTAPAKVNLALHVTGQRNDGYHLLDSMVVFADVADDLSLTPSDTMTMTVNGDFAKGVPTDARNLVWAAAEYCGAKYDIFLTKNIPHGAGLGGGSADAAAVLRHLDCLEFATQLGADVPVCLRAVPQRMRGIGEHLDHAPNVPSFAMVLVNPGEHVSTPEIFAALDHKDNPGLGPMPESSNASDWLDWLALQRNDLQTAAIRVAPEIKDALEALDGALLARMSGSGCTCFGVYPTRSDAETAAQRISKSHPDWWVSACQTVGASVS